MGRVTLLGSALARPGFEYQFLRACEVADRCPVAATCQNLEVGHKYRVTSVRAAAKPSACTEHADETVRAVEVEELPRFGNVPESRLRGTKIQWQEPVCVNRGCPVWNDCFGTGFQAAASYVVKDAGAPVTCAMGYKLRRVRLEPS